MVCVKRNIRDQGIQDMMLLKNPNKNTEKIPVVCIIISYLGLIFIPFFLLSCLYVY